MVLYLSWCIAVYEFRPFPFSLISSILGIIGESLLALVILSFQIYATVFVGWDVPFPGPFMSMAIVEGPALILGSIAVCAHSILSREQERSITYFFLPIVTLIYGIGVFIGPLILAFSLWNHIWKAPWLPPLHDVSGWVINTTMLWSAGLFILACGGILSIASSYMGFHFVVSKQARALAKARYSRTVA